MKKIFSRIINDFIKFALATAALKNMFYKIVDEKRELFSL